MSEQEIDYKELLLGCGSQRDKRLYAGTMPKGFLNLTTLDIEKRHNPDVVFDLQTAFLTGQLLPFESNSFNEIHAYEVLEHIGTQGDYRSLFFEFEEYYRILKPGGFFAATVPTPSSEWAFGDPSHTRIFHPHWLMFLDQDSYEQVGTTPMSDFRSIYKANFKTVATGVDESENIFYFLLQKKEPRSW